jgi:tetratricopeptide (TPR) repeat protein
VRDAGEPKNVGAALVNIGFALTALGQIEQASQALQEALQIFESVGFDTGVAHAQLGFGRIHARCRSHGEALDCYERAARIFQETGDIATLSETLAERAALQVGRGRLEEAIEVGAQALRLSRHSGSRHNEARALAALGRAHRDRGDLQLARTHLENAHAILTALGHPQAAEAAADLAELTLPAPAGAEVL